MTTKEILTRIGYVRNCAGLSAREVSLRIGMSSQYISKVEGGHIVLTVDKLVQILEVCNFPIERFFSKDINDYNTNNELVNLIENFPTEKKKYLIELLRK